MTNKILLACIVVAVLLVKKITGCVFKAAMLLLLVGALYIIYKTGGIKL